MVSSCASGHNLQVGLFTDVHRWLALQADEIEVLRGRHQSSNVRHQEAIQNCVQQMHHDVKERRKQFHDFTTEMEQHTLRKFDVLQDELAHLNAKRTCPPTRMAIMKEHQMDGLLTNLDNLHESLCSVGDSMVSLATNCCAPEPAETTTPDVTMSRSASAPSVKPQPAVSAKSMARTGSTASVKAGARAPFPRP